MTFEASRLTVLAMTAPQPSLKARLMTLRLVPGGPEPMTNGLGSFRPSTVVASVGMAELGWGETSAARDAQHEGSQSSGPAIPRAATRTPAGMWVEVIGGLNAA